MKPALHSMDGPHIRVYFWYFLCIFILFLVAMTADQNLSHDVFKSSSFTFAAVILSFPMYLLFSLLPLLLSNLIGDFSVRSLLMTNSNGFLFILYLVIGCPLALNHLLEESAVWQLFVPFFLAAGIESLYLAIKGYAPIELSKCFQEAPSIGEVWANACSSYYLEVFKDFKKRLYKFEKKQTQLDEMFTIGLKKMIILIPLSCDAEGTLEKHPNIKYYDILDIHVDARGGNVNRQYKNPVYRITSTDGNNTHHMYIAIEEPNTLVALKKIKKSIPEEIWKFQRSEFISTLRDRLSNEACKILIYDDLQEEGPVLPLSEFLIREIRKLCIAEKNE